MKNIDYYNVRNLVMDYFDRILQHKNLTLTETKTIELIKSDVARIFEEHKPKKGD